MQLRCLCILTYTEHYLKLNETAAAYSEGLKYKCRSEYLLFRLWYYISLDNDKLDAHLLCFTIRPLHSSTCFEHYMLIIRRLIALTQHLVSSSQSVAVQCTGWERTALQFSLNLCTERPLTERTIPDAASMQLASWWWAFNAWNM